MRYGAHSLLENSGFSLSPPLARSLCLCLWMAGYPLRFLSLAVCPPWVPHEACLAASRVRIFTGVPVPSSGPHIHSLASALLGSAYSHSKGLRVPSLWPPTRPTPAC